MNLTVTGIRNYYGTEYFTNLKIPTNFIDNFLQFIYSSENLYPYVERNNYDAIAIYIDKYLPIYQRRLRNSHLIEINK